MERHKGGVRISKRVQMIAPSATLSISAKAQELKRQGVDVISFSAGEPDFDTPSFIKEEAKRAIDAGFTKYTPTPGIPELREAICEKLKRENGLLYSPQEVIVSCGAKHSLYNAIMTLCEPGDEVLLPIPFWVTYLEQIRLAGGEPIFVPCVKESLAPDLGALERAITPRTKLLILNNPSNPTGVVLDEKALERIARIAVEKDIYVISDEIYEHLVYEVPFPRSIATFPGMKERTVVVNGVSKTFAMTGWRIGYAAGPRDVIEGMARLQDHMTSNPTSMSQKAALAALCCPSSVVREMVDTFNARRKLILHHLADIPHISFPIPQGAFYVFVDFSKYCQGRFAGEPIGDSVHLAELLLEKAHIALVPGSAFGMEGYLRFSYATSERAIETGMKRLKDFLKRVE
ncbi:pyridoxal phosphate-dependent aminotransferase [Candidatus Caldatribacterium sp.]|uniref:pyridoxal phosphate-dependent aminotransferase n=1 Tax=Candidatus Caldatribacterium sp. TaxID=2282143 RepID=UPI0029921A80|nr:pyridoxal phosphate-dependent aminotransferase [Candidatus Calescibacterium sp.]